MPPASAKASAPLICRRSKYRTSKLWTSVAANRFVGAHRTGSLGVLRPQSKVAFDDAPRHHRHTRLDRRIIGFDLDDTGPPEVEEDEPRSGPAGDQSSPCSYRVEAKLRCVGLDQCPVQGGVGFVVNQDRAAVEHADPVNDTAHPGRPTTFGELDLRP